ncbi:MAG: NAD(P)/FAD-dependent oxidoreductase [Geminicoccaceae bacterium]
MSRAPRVAVIGAGVVGVSCAEWLRRDGHEVTLYDRREPGEGASFGNGGVIACAALVPVPVPGLLKKAPAMLFDPDKPLFLRWSYLPKLLPWLARYLGTATKGHVEHYARSMAPLLSDAVEQHQALAKGTPAERWIQTGDYLYLYTDRSAFGADAFGWEIRARHGIAGTEMDRQELTEADPHLGEAYRFGFRMGGHGWITDPGAYVKDLAAWFQGQGGFFVRATVDRVAPGDAGVTISAGGSHERFDHAVIATGAWSQNLAKSLGHEARLESERGYHIHLEGPNITPPYPYMVADQKYVATPMAGALRIAGIVEFGGLEAGPSRAPFRHYERALKRLYPNLTWTGKSEWLGHRPSTTASLPMLGTSPKQTKIHFAFGHQHVGLTSGPKSGRLIADLIQGRKPNIDLSSFRIDRFD